MANQSVVDWSTGVSKDTGTGETWTGSGKTSTYRRKGRSGGSNKTSAQIYQEEQARKAAAASAASAAAATKKANEAAAAAAKQESIKRIFLSQQSQTPQSIFQTQSQLQSRDQSRINQQFIDKVSSPESRAMAAASAAKKADKANRFRVGLSEEEKQKPLKEVIISRYAEVGGGIARAGLAITEGSINLFSKFGVQTGKVNTETGEFEGLAQEPFKFKGALATRIRNEPLSTGNIIGQAAVYAPLAGAAVASTATSISAIGVRATAAEIASSFSPLKIRAGTFGGLTATGASRTRFDVVSQKVTSGGKTFRYVAGRGGKFGDVSVFSRQVSQKGVGVAQTNIISKEVQYVGGKFIPQVRTLTANQVFVSKTGSASQVFSGDIAARTSLSGVLGSGSRAITTKISQTLVTPTATKFTPNILSKPFVQTAAGTSTQKDSLTFFAAGKATGAGGILRTSQANIRGVEVDLTKLFGKGAGTTIVGSGGTSTKSVSSSAAQQISSSLGATKIVPTQITTQSTAAVLPFLAPPKTKSPEAQIAQATKSSSIFQVTKQEEKTITSTTSTQDLGVVTTPTTATTPLVVQRSSGGSKSKSRQDAVPRLDVTPNQIPEQITKVTPITSPRQKLRQVPRLPSVPTIPITTPRITETPKLGFSFKLPSYSAPTSSGAFGVQIRRGGQFFSIGNFKTASQAFQKGLDVTSGTLAATFRVSGPGKIPGAPKGFRTKKTDLGTLFIEKRGKRLSKKSETREIQAAKKSKRKRKK